MAKGTKNTKKNNGNGNTKTAKAKENKGSKKTAETKAAKKQDNIKQVRVPTRKLAGSVKAAGDSRKARLCSYLLEKIIKNDAFTGTPELRRKLESDKSARARKIKEMGATLRHQEVRAALESLVADGELQRYELDGGVYYGLADWRAAAAS